MVTLGDLITKHEGQGYRRNRVFLNVAEGIAAVERMEQASEYDALSLANLFNLLNKIVERETERVRGLLPKIYQLCCDGAISLDRSQFTGTDRDLLKSHLYGYASNAARKIFETGELEWGEKWYTNVILSGRCSIGAGSRKHAANCYAIAGIASEQMYRRVNASDNASRLIWVSRWYSRRIDAAEAFERIDSMKAAYNYGFAADGAEEWFRITGQVDKAELWFLADKKAAEQARFDAKFATRSLEDARRAANLLYSRTGEPQWLDEQINCCQGILEQNPRGPLPILGPVRRTLVKLLRERENI